MKKSADSLRLAATDLSNHLSCRHLTERNLGLAFGVWKAPDWFDPDAAVLQERGREHEDAYLASLTAQGVQIVDLRGVMDEREAVKQSQEAMQDGAEAIAQAALSSGQWFGRADVLRRVDEPSQLGLWSYEAYDCKLARDTKASTIVQLAFYSDLLKDIQGLLPGNMYVVLPGDGFTVEAHRVLDSAAYFRFVRSRLHAATSVEPGTLTTYPEPVPHCDVCRWWQQCDRRRRSDDHLSLVAGITSVQRKQLRAWNTATVAALAQLPLPLRQRPERGSRDSYERVREQARVQVAGRKSGKPVHELLPVREGLGLARLPEPSRGDLFLDLEGDQFAGSHGMEYLFGFVDNTRRAKYHCKWALKPAEERAAFQWLVDSFMEAWAAHPEMHVYHFTAYEPGALKRLMGRYATREDEIDRMLRAGLFIDLHAVLKQAVRASVEQYSLKSLEAFYEFSRTTPLEAARVAIREVEHALELRRGIEFSAATRQTLEGYNRDDCASTRVLRDWLETQRAAHEAEGHCIPRPPLLDGAPSEKIGEEQARTGALVQALIEGIPVDEAERDAAQNATYLLAHMVEFHRREKKADYWEAYRLRDLSEDDLLDEKSAIAGLEHKERRVEGKSIIDSYSYPEQETDVSIDDEVHQKGDKVGDVAAIDHQNRLVSVKRNKKTRDWHPSSLYASSIVGTKPLSDSVFRLAEWVLNNGIDAPGPYRAARDLLLRLPPRRRSRALVTVEGELAIDAAKRLVTSLDHGVLAIQGPPGSGKTYIGARLICELVRQGKRVGVTAVSHAVIANLLQEVVRAGQEEGLSDLRIVQKVSSAEGTGPITELTKNEEAREALRGEANVAGGTAWLWSREDFQDAVDVLVVDEAGQMSLANVLAVAQSAANLVLLGDPQQLEQPLRGSHPEGADVSALAHLLGEHHTIQPEQGLFLPLTWRLHPTICRFTSEVFYDSRLDPLTGLEGQGIHGHPWIGPAGLWYVPIEHCGNTNTSPEEVIRIRQIVESLLDGSVTWTDRHGHTRPLAYRDILIVAPYNAQVNRIAAEVRARTGTVDRFQGQEAPVLIYSLTTSSPEEAPRGMEFLYSANRLNVASSRARAAVILVGSPRLFEPECRSPRQIQLANAFCRFQELAATVASAGASYVGPHVQVGVSNPHLG